MLENQNYQSIYIIKRLLREYVKPYKNQAFMAMFFMVIVAVCSALIVKMIEPTVNEVLIGRHRELMYVLPATIFLLYCIKGGAEYFQSYIIKFVGQQLLTDLQVVMYEKLLLCDLTFLDKYPSGRLMSRFTNDIVLMRAAVANMLVALAKHFMSVILLIIVMFMMDFHLAMFAICLFPIAIYPIMRNGYKIRTIVGSAQEELSIYTAQLDETFSAIKVIKAFAKEKEEAQRARKVVSRLLEHYKNTAKLDALNGPIMEILTGLAVAFILSYGCYTILNGQSTPGQLFAFLAAFTSAYRPFKSLILLNANIQEGIAAANRVFNILDTEIKEIDKPNAKTLLDTNLTKKNIIFRKIYLNFENESNSHDAKGKALNGLSIELLGGKISAIIGRSGSGKTSIANLLMRLYRPTSGDILVGNESLDNFTTKSIRQNIAFVSQDTVLFDGTVAENIAYGNKKANFDLIKQAAIIANADDFISQLPNGYDTYLTANGSRLSGGQKQRLSIARAVLCDAPILILDEATSQLDYQIEQKIIAAISEIRKGKTTIIITHRIKSAKICDKIFIISEGVCTKSGSFDDLTLEQLSLLS